MLTTRNFTCFVLAAILLSTSISPVTAEAQAQAQRSDYAVESTTVLPALMQVWQYYGQKSGDRVGATLASGDVNADGYMDVLVGTPKDRYDNFPYGSVAVFFGGAQGIATTPQQLLFVDAQGADFGAAIAHLGDINGDGYADFAVGAPRFGTTDTGAEAGAVYVFHGSAGGLRTPAAWSTVGPQAQAQFGYAVAGGGDYNGDGWTDLAVGAPFHTNDQDDEGRVYLFEGSATGFLTTTVETLEREQAKAYYGTTVAFIGDANGDGCDDIAIGAPRYDNIATDEGAVFVHMGRPLSTSPGDLDWSVFLPLILTSESAGLRGWTIYGGQAYALLGSSLYGTDFNQDGFSDLVAGAPGYDHTADGEGAAFVFAGSATGLYTAPLWQGYGGQQSAGFGAAVDGSGDVNGDGFIDLAVGAPYYTPPLEEDPQDKEGAVFVFVGNNSGLNGTPTWRMDGNKAETEFGLAVLIAGRTNNDAFDDVVVGSPTFRISEDKVGAAFLYFGVGTLQVSFTPLLEPGQQVFRVEGWNVRGKR